MQLVEGVGINDSGYKISLYERREGKLVQYWICPYYKAWKSMLVRCYNKKYHLTRPTYSETSVCEEWLTFSNFRKWMETQDWNNRALDKDLLGDGTIYSPDTCCFLTSKVNTFIVEQNRNIKTGVTQRYGRYISRIQDINTAKVIQLGTFDTEAEAREMWKAKKHEYACQLANEETDVRIKEALVARYKCSI